MRDVYKALGISDSRADELLSIARHYCDEEYAKGGKVSAVLEKISVLDLTDCEKVWLAYETGYGSATHEFEEAVKSGTKNMLSQILGKG